MIKTSTGMEPTDDEEEDHQIDGTETWIETYDGMQVAAQRARSIELEGILHCKKTQGGHFMLSNWQMKKNTILTNV